jgi:hypothetical protein
MMRDPLTEERARAVEIVQIGVPIICEVVAVTLFIAACAVWIIVTATEIPA